MISAVRALWLAVVLLFSCLVGLAGGGLAWISGENPAVAVLTGSGAFAAAVSLTILIISFVTHPQSDQTS
jgi:hypothetical protein